MSVELVSHFKENTKKTALRRTIKADSRLRTTEQRPSKLQAHTSPTVSTGHAASKEKYEMHTQFYS